MDSRRNKMASGPCGGVRGPVAVLAVVVLLLILFLSARGPPEPPPRRAPPAHGGGPSPRVWAANWIRPDVHADAKGPGGEVTPEAIQKIIEQRQPYVPPAIKTPYNFTGFNNVTGLGEESDYLVPNFMHFLRFNEVEFDFLDFVTVLSALRHQRPERLFFHTNVERFKGEYWEKLLLTPGFADIVEMVHVDLPSEIFGQPMDNGYRVWHAGDITRIRILMKYGGIFLDNDSYMVQSLDKFRRFEIAMGWDDNQFMGTQVIVAHREARFLREWLETYRGAYDKNKWYYNAGERPTVEVLYKRPELLHRVKLLFGVHYLIHKVYKANEVWAEWRDQYCIHLLKRHQDKKFDEDNFSKPPTTLREMILDVYDPLSGGARLL